MTPLRRTRIVGPVGPWPHFNAGLLRWQGRLLLAYRSGTRNSRIYLTTLAEDYRPTSTRPLDLDCPMTSQGAEDPRLFEHQGRVWVVFTGNAGSGGISVLLARLSEDVGRVEAMYYPDYPLRDRWEKNWGCFSYNGELYCVYDINPHMVLHIDTASPYRSPTTTLTHPRSGQVIHMDTSKLECLTTSLCYLHTWQPPPALQTTMLRGGASPVRVGEEFWSFYHTKSPQQDPRVPNMYGYAIGVYTFAAQPPFKPLRCLPGRLWAVEDESLPRGLPYSVTFPCGAVSEGGVWKVSCGIHDAWVEVVEFDHAELERALVKVTHDAAQDVRPDLPAIPVA